MSNSHKKLHLNIKGRPVRPFHGLIVRLQTKKLGLSQPEITYKKGQVNITVTGEKAKLWKVVEYSKRSGLVSKLQEIDFQFRDLELA